MNSPLPASQRQRLDELLVERGLFASRSRARDAIERGTVTVDGAVARKPGQSVVPDCLVAIDDPAQAYVSRAALKLIAGLDHFGLDASGSEALDIGASTGGFTQVLLERGAAHVTAIDVGHGQIHPDIAGDPRVTVIEGLNARDLTAADLGGHIPDFLVCDVSFISLKLALPPALALAGEGARALLLVKPQFEAGREAIGKGGLLKDPGDAEHVAVDLRDWLAAVSGWRVLGLHPSPIAGGDGNREFLLAAIKDAGSK
ncbi:MULTISPECIES: TlyA family RNA methyltransferase [unclassified Mesorhizobium]|uniref:TlyA family RNA methyltransferase n=1 Tax=unclassified Mesorhizobium TaxID=325217 RepID=UPI000F753845|nr:MULTISPECIES: TlyA family RNA methyltransferase [unclassified Mesorhizobium]AZO31592.1 TlyA family RNA methyltransferase [Mesorhizobium sp. M1B.F.Ca.ET.045.04.1.1]RWA61100.1 MAG: TlyA family rRNA (cytidine-2'-O)-methyltransferase [Mesorhizobium sp.]RWB22945.1 MAG: TlyA family rRNA (cytidine-2'-O)-methyltransferase [Mesorhizobium sp.]